MCKYNKYIVEVIHLNGNKEVIQNEKNTSYKATMQLYNRAKLDNEGKNVRINFVGLNDEEYKILFTKKFSVKDTTGNSIENLIKTLYETSNKLSEEFKNVIDRVGYIDKQKSRVEHLLIEAASSEHLTDETRIDIFNQFRSYLLERRDWKILSQIAINSKSQVNQIKDLIENVYDIYNTNISKHEEIIIDLMSDETEKSQYKDVHLVRKYPYKNHKERINIVKQIEHKYHKIVHIPEEKVVACYNKCVG